jgi:hypothetical protein
MTAILWVVALVLTASVVSLGVVPYFRALPVGSPTAVPPDDLRREIERELETLYCLQCGVAFENVDGRRCESCGAPRPGAS